MADGQERVFQRFETDGRLHRVEFDDLRPGDLYVSLDLPLDETSVERGDVIYLASSFPRNGCIDVSAQQAIGFALCEPLRTRSVLMKCAAGILSPNEARELLRGG